MMSEWFEVWLRMSNWAWMALPKCRHLASAESFKSLTRSSRDVIFSIMQQINLNWFEAAVTYREMLLIIKRNNLSPFF